MIDDPLDQSGILHQCAAFAVGYDLGDRAAHVDVEQIIIVSFPQHPGGFRHDLRLGAEELETDRVFLR